MAIRYTNAVWTIEGLGHTVKIVLNKLADNANDYGYCWPSVAYIAKLCSLSERTVQLVIRKLEVMGYLDTQTRRKQSSLYILTNIPHLTQLTEKRIRQLDAKGVRPLACQREYTRQWRLAMGMDLDYADAARRDDAPEAEFARPDKGIDVPSRVQTTAFMGESPAPRTVIEPLKRSAKEDSDRKQKDWRGVSRAARGGGGDYGFDPSEDDILWRARMRGFVAHNVWIDDVYGASRPGMAGCRVPEHVQREFGYAP